MVVKTVSYEIFLSVFLRYSDNLTMKKYLILILALPVFAMAEDGNTNSDLERVRELAEDVRDVVTHHSAPDMHPNPQGNFRLTTEQADRIHAVSALDEEIVSLNVTVPDCNETGGDVSEDEMAERLKKRKFKIFFEVRYNSLQHDGAAQYGYGSNAFGPWLSANGTSAGIYNLGNLKTRYKNRNGSVDLDSLSVSEQEKRLREFAKSQYGLDIPENLMTPDLAYDHIRANPNDWATTLRGLKNNMSFDQKAKLVARFGGAFGDNYNYDRADGTGAYADGIVTIEELIESTKGKHPGGVCRDVALAQAQMMKELGVPNSYIVAYKTPGGFHANLITQDPSDPNKVIKMNYGYMTGEENVTGNTVLRQDTTMPDMGLRYRIYNSEGKPVAKLPSELGQMYSEMTGGNQLDPLMSRNYSLSQVGVQGQNWRGRLFVGQTSTGEQVIGAATDFNYEYGDDILNIDGGLAVSTMQGQRSLVEIDQQNLFARVRGELNSPYLEVGNFGIRAQGTAEAKFMLSNNTVVKRATGSTLYDEKAELSFDTDYTAAIQSHWDSEDGNTNVDAEVRAFFYDDHKNVAAGTSGGHGLHLDKTLVRVGVQHQLGSDYAVLADTGVVLRDVGDSAFFRAGMVMNQGRTVASMTYEKPLDADMPRFLPGSTEKVGVGVSHETGPFNFSLTYNRDLDIDQDQFMLGAGIKF